jgi:hypothetical protein
MDPFDDIQCEEIFPDDAYEGVPEDEPPTEAEMEKWYQQWVESERVA